MSINDIRDYLNSLNIEEIPEMIKTYELDTRQGVKNLCVQYKKRYADYMVELNRIQQMKDFDLFFCNYKEDIIAGVDEAGRGPLAGPVVAAAVILPRDTVIKGINDSKKIIESKRNILYDEIMDKAICVGVGIVDSDEIDEINILQATFKAMEIAVGSLELTPITVLVDGNMTTDRLSKEITEHAVIKGDSKSMSIAAASIIAKVTRDRIMYEYNKMYPEYEFGSNKGYGSKEHQLAIKGYGPCPIHRKSFIKKLLKESH